jgi:methyl coenzyme M reductase subunit D
MSETTNVSVTLGYTLNLGNFQSLRVDIGVTDFVRSGENTDTAVERVYEFVESKVLEKVQEAKTELEG